MAANRRASPMRKWTQVMQWRKLHWEPHMCMALLAADSFSAPRPSLGWMLLVIQMPAGVLLPQKGPLWPPALNTTPPAITPCQSSLLLFSSLHSSRIFFLLLPLECNNHPIRDCPSSLDPQRLFQILAQSRSSTNICKMKTVCCTRGNPRFYSSLNFEFLAQKQIRATLKHEDHLCDLGLPCHLFPGAISQCKV